MEPGKEWRRGWALGAGGLFPGLTGGPQRRTPQNRVSDSGAITSRMGQGRPDPEAPQGPETTEAFLKRQVRKSLPFVPLCDVSAQKRAGPPPISRLPGSHHGTVNLSPSWPDFTDEDDFEQVSRPPVSD